MIRTCKDEDARKIRLRLACRRYLGLHDVILRKLIAIDAALILEDLRHPPGNRLEALKGDRLGQYSIRINDQFRLCFKYEWALQMKSKLSITTKSTVATRKRRAPVHPGEMLREEFMLPMGLSSNALAIALQVPATRINEIVKERRGITGDTALRLGRYFRMTAEFWMNLQSNYELELARDQFESTTHAIRPAAVDKQTGALKLKEVA